MSPEYSESLCHIGTPRRLAESGGRIVERAVPGTHYLDAMGAYPIFQCSDWSRLHEDLERERDLVSLGVVADPFGPHDPAYLRRCFPDLVSPFKEHAVIDLQRSPGSFVRADHQRKARRALDQLAITRCADPRGLAADWIALYAQLVERRGIRGPTAFPAESLRAQLIVPGAVVFRAALGDSTVGMTIWYADAEIGYFHLGAYNEDGYRLGASFGIFSEAIRHFSDFGLKWLDLGAGAGLNTDTANDGLLRFKTGWATGTRTAYFCGRVFDRERYKEATKAAVSPSSSFFPAYRAGEFA
jgi:hypothetical protein